MSKWITTKQAAARLQAATHDDAITPQRVRDLIRSGRLAARKAGRVWLIWEGSLEKVHNRKPGRPRKNSDLAKERQSWRRFQKEEQELAERKVTPLEWHLHPKVKTVLDNLADFKKALPEWRRMVEIGKFSPEAIPFLAKRLREVARAMHDLADWIEQHD